MSVLASDAFTRANGGLGANWTTITGEGSPQISTNRVRTTAVGTDSEARYSAVSFPNDQYSQVAIITSSSNSTGAGAIARASNSANTWYGAYGKNLGSATLTVVKCVAGAHSNLTSAGKTIASGDIVRIEASGTSISGYINGVLQSGPTTDSAIASGDAGVVVFADAGTTADAELDDWEGGDFTSGAAAASAPLLSTAMRPTPQGLIGRVAMAMRALRPPQALVTSATFTDSVTESGTAADTETATADFIGARAEALTAADASTGALTAVVARTETLAAADTETGTVTTGVSAADTLSAADSETGALTAVVAAAETLSATESETGALVAAVARAESLTAADAQDATVTAAGQSAQAESVSAADSQTATVVYAVATTEALSASDADVATLVAQASRAESLTAADASTGSLVAQGLQTETLSVVDSVVAAALLQAAVNDALAVLAAQTGTSSGDLPLVLVDAPLYVDFADLRTSIDFADLATHIVFLSPTGEEIMGPLHLFKGEVVDVPFVLRGAGGVAQSVIGASSIKWTVGKPGATPIVNAADLTPVVAGSGSVKYPANAALTAAGGKYKSLAVVTFPGSPPIVRKFPGDVEIADAIV